MIAKSLALGLQVKEIDLWSQNKDHACGSMASLTSLKNIVFMNVLYSFHFLKGYVLSLILTIYIC